MRQVSLPMVVCGLACLATLACHDRPDAPPAQPDAPAAANTNQPANPTVPTTPETPEHAGRSHDPQPPGPPGDSGVDDLHRLEGQLEADLIDEFGDPTSQREFTMGECCTEFEVELRNTYPSKSGHEDVAIRQWDWDYEGYTLTVWLHQVEGQWVALDTCRYSDDVEF